jgi:hypothetical protein
MRTGKRLYLSAEEAMGALKRWIECGDKAPEAK